VRSDIAKAKRDIQKADFELRRADSLMRDENQRAAQAEERGAKDRERRDKEIGVLQARLKESQGKIDAEKNAMARAQNAIDEIKSREKQAAKLLAGWCDTLALRVESGLPWDNQVRLDRIHALKRDLEAGTATPEEGLTRLNAILKEEVKAGDEIAVFNKPITRQNGESINAQVLRLGNQYLAYMDEEGKTFGILERKAGKWAWREDLSFAEKNRLKEAIEVKTAKRPPSLVVLDLGLDVQKGGAQ
jgi:chromosome segregation ATPase